MIRKLKAGTYAAVISDDTQLIPRARLDDSCSLHILPDPIEPYDLAFAFRSGFPLPALRTQISNTLLKLGEEGVLAVRPSRRLFLCDEVSYPLPSCGGNVAELCAGHRRGVCAGAAVVPRGDRVLRNEPGRGRLAVRSLGHSCRCDRHRHCRGIGAFLRHHSQAARAPRAAGQAHPAAAGLAVAGGRSGGSCRRFPRRWPPPAPPCALERLDCWCAAPLRSSTLCAHRSASRVRDRGTDARRCAELAPPPTAASKALWHRAASGKAPKLAALASLQRTEATGSALSVLTEAQEEQRLAADSLRKKQQASAAVASADDNVIDIHATFPQSSDSDPSKHGATHDTAPTSPTAAPPRPNPERYLAKLDSLRVMAEPPTPSADGNGSQAGDEDSGRHPFQSMLRGRRTASSSVSQPPGFRDSAQDHEASAPVEDVPGELASLLALVQSVEARVGHLVSSLEDSHAL